MILLIPMQTEMEELVFDNEIEPDKPLLSATATSVLDDFRYLLGSSPENVKSNTFDESRFVALFWTKYKWPYYYCNDIISLRCVQFAKPFAVPIICDIAMVCVTSPSIPI